MKDVYVILGAGGFAREVFWHLRETYPNVDCVFVDDVNPGNSLSFRGEEKDYPILKDWDFEKFNEKFNLVGFLVGVGEPHVKKILVEKALACGLRPAPTLIHPAARIQGVDCELGVGGIICPGVVVTTNVHVGDYVVLNLNTTVGHDASIGDYSTANPGCHISGNTTLGEGVSLGTGTTLREKTSISDGVITGAQSCVVKSITESNVIVTGVPAQKLVKK